MPSQSIGVSAFSISFDAQVHGGAIDRSEFVDIGIGDPSRFSVGAFDESPIGVLADDFDDEPFGVAGFLE